MSDQMENEEIPLGARLIMVVILVEPDGRPHVLRVAEGCTKLVALSFEAMAEKLEGGEGMWMAALYREGDFSKPLRLLSKGRSG